MRWEDERWQLAAHPGDSITWLKAPLLHYNTNGKVQYEHASLHNGISNSANSNGAEWTFEKLKNPTDTATIFATKGTGAHARLHTPTGRIAVVQHLPQWCIDLFQDTVSDSSANWFHTTSTDDNSNTAIIVAELENAPNTPQATVAAVLAKTPPFMATFVTVPVDGEGTKLYQHIGGSKADDNECVVFFSGKDGLKPEQDESGGLTKLRYAFDATEEQKKQFSETLLSDFDPTWWKPTLPIELDIAGKEASAQDLYSGACDYKAGLAGIVYARSMAWSKSRADASELSPDTIHPNPHLADAILPLSMTPAVVARHVYGAARVAAVQKTLATTENDINFASDLAVDALLTSCVSVEQDYTDANRKLQSTGRALLRALNNNTDPRTPDALAAMVQYAYSKHAVLAIAAAHQRLFTRDAAIDLAVARAAEHYKVYTTFIPLVETGVPEAAFSVLELKPDTTFTASQFSSQVAEYSNADYQEAKTANICTKYSSDEWETGRGKMKHTITDSSIQGVFCGIMQYAVRVSDTKEITLYRGSDNDFELLEKESDEERRSELHALVTLARCDQRLQKNCASNTQLECGELTMHRTSGVVTSSDGKLSHVINAPEADGSLLIQATYEDSPSFKMCVAVPFIITPARDHLDIAVIAAIAKQYPKHRLKSARSSSGLPLEMEAFTKDRDIYIKTGDSDNPWKYNNIYDSELLLAVN
ncbi:hypothetical protein [Nereida ignava]|uniref:hypothetical protein n=1 Tax=Nereida ignava TaxID=282199 RepID=UPI0030FCCAC1